MFAQWRSRVGACGGDQDPVVVACDRDLDEGWSLCDAVFEKRGQACVRRDCGRPEPAIRCAGLPRFLEADQQESLGLLAGEFGEAQRVLQLSRDQVVQQERGKPTHQALHQDAGDEEDFRLEGHYSPGSSPYSFSLLYSVF